ncbi:MAG: hypothetical protein VZR64_03285 [Eubacterium sp.]|nr:hypothetical protein [Eubacterium sp.]
MKKTYLKRFTGIILTTALLFSGVGCGETNTVVDDYGSSSESTEASDKGTSTDSQSVSTGNDKTLKDIYGDKVYVNNDYEVGDVTIKGNATFVVPEQEYLNAYNMQACDDGLKDEDIVVKALLGDTAEKLESIKYENSSDYMTLLYKYRSILLAYENEKKYTDTHVNVSYSNRIDRSIITESTGENYTWKDDDDLYIHMYEGTRNNTKFVLLLAYDYISNTRYIFLEPKSITEYFPGFNFETLLIATDKNQNGEDLEIDNACTTSYEEIKSSAEDLIANELHLDSSYSITDNPDKYSMILGDNVVQVASPFNTSSPFSHKDPGKSVLMFSDCDFRSTLKKQIEGLAVDYKVLAEQRDLMAEYKEEHPDSDREEYEFIFSDTSTSLADVPNITVDGYAVYLNDNLTLDTESQAADYIGLSTSNSGIIKYTSNGLYSIDLTLSETVVDVIENVKLVPFEKIEESFKTALEEQVDFSKIDNPKELTVDYLGLYYGRSNTDDSNTYTSVPTWVFSVTTQTGLGCDISISATDGSISEISYFNFQI